MIENNEILGARIKRRREEMNISVAEIAEQTGLSRATIHRYESGDIKRLKLPVIESIAEMLNVTPEWIIGKTDDRHQAMPLYDVQQEGSTDIKYILENLSEFILEHEGLTFDGQPMSNELKFTLLSSLSTTLKIAEKMR